MTSGILFLATFFYLGYAPFVPGTFGTLGGVLIVLALHRFGAALGFYLLVTVLFLLLAVWVSAQAERFLEEKDPRVIVMDEAVGFLIAMLGLPVSWPLLLAGFALFRLLDVWKPFGARRVQSLSGGWGIVLDDLIAGLYTNLLLRIILMLFS